MEVQTKYTQTISAILFPLYLKYIGVIFNVALSIFPLVCLRLSPGKQSYIERNVLEFLN